MKSKNTVRNQQNRRIQLEQLEDRKLQAADLAVDAIHAAPSNHAVQAMVAKQLTTPVVVHCGTAVQSAVPALQAHQADKFFSMPHLHIPNIQIPHISLPSINHVIPHALSVPTPVLAPAVQQIVATKPVLVSAPINANVFATAFQATNTKPIITAKPIDTKVNLEPVFGDAIEKMVKSVTPSTFRKGVDCKEFTIDSKGNVSMKIDVTYKISAFGVTLAKATIKIEVTTNLYDNSKLQIKITVGKLRSFTIGVDAGAVKQAVNGFIGSNAGAMLKARQ